VSIFTVGVDSIPDIGWTKAVSKWGQGQALAHSKGFLKEILELHKRGGSGTKSPSGVPGRGSGPPEAETFSFAVTNFNGIFEQFYAY